MVGHVEHGDLGRGILHSLLLMPVSQGVSCRSSRQHSPMSAPPLWAPTLILRVQAQGEHFAKASVKTMQGKGWVL